MNQYLLNKILSEEQRAIGLYLEESPLSILLCKAGQPAPIAVFPLDAPIEDIQQEAHQTYESTRNGVSFERLACLSHL